MRQKRSKRCQRLPLHPYLHEFRRFLFALRKLNHGTRRKQYDTNKPAFLYKCNFVPLHAIMPNPKQQIVDKGYVWNRSYIERQGADTGSS